VLEAAGAEEHEGEQEEVVGSVHQDAGGEGTGSEARRAEDKADGDQQEEWAKSMGGLLGVHPGKRNAGEDGGDEHGGTDHCGWPFPTAGGDGCG